MALCCEQYVTLTLFRPVQLGHVVEHDPVNAQAAVLLDQLFDLQHFLQRPRLNLNGDLQPMLLGVLLGSAHHVVSA